MQAMSGTLFKFRYVQNGQPRGLAAKKAIAGADGLDLNGQILRYADILDTTSRDNRLVLVLAPGASLDEKTRRVLTAGQGLVLEISKIKALHLERQIDRCASAVAADRHRQELIATGKAELFSTVACPRCGSEIDVSETEKTHYLHCRFCETILDRAPNTPAQPEGYEVCEQCGMFGRVRGYTVFYFYFLLVLYGFSYNRRHLCDACAEKQAQKTLLLNLIFILGIPSAVYMWIKALSGRDAAWKDLPRANKLARQGKYQQADALYDRLLMSHPEHPGLLLNKTMGHLLGQDGLGTVEHLNNTLKACANYRAARSLAARLQQAAQQGMAAKPG